MRFPAERLAVYLDPGELDLLVAEIGDRILGLRAGSAQPACTGCAALCGPECERGIRAILASGASRISAAEANAAPELAALTELHLLRPDITADEVQARCRAARRDGYAAVIVAPCHAAIAVSALKGSDVVPGVAVGFPFGMSASGTKRLETATAIRMGAGEIDMVMNIGTVKSNDLDRLMIDTRSVIRAAQGVPVKVIIETTFLSEREKAVAFAVAKLAGARYIKTGSGGTSVDDIVLMQRVAGDGPAPSAPGSARIAASASVEIQGGV